VRHSVPGEKAYLWMVTIRSHRQSPPVFVASVTLGY